MLFVFKEYQTPLASLLLVLLGRTPSTTRRRPLHGPSPSPLPELAGESLPGCKEGGGKVLFPCDGKVFFLCLGVFVSSAADLPVPACRHQTLHFSVLRLSAFVIL